MRPHFIRTALNGLLVSTTLASAKVYPTPETIEGLCEACADAAERGNDGAVAVVYDSNTIRVYEFDQCIPYSLNNNDGISTAYFCQSATCFVTPTTDCTGSIKLLTGEAIPAGIMLYNAVDVRELGLNSLRCERNAMPISNIPIAVPVLCPIIRNIDYLYGFHE